MCRERGRGDFRGDPHGVSVAVGLSYGLDQAAFEDERSAQVQVEMTAFVAVDILMHQKRSVRLY